MEKMQYFKYLLTKIHPQKIHLIQIKSNDDHIMTYYIIFNINKNDNLIEKYDHLFFLLSLLFQNQYESNIY